MQSEIKSTIDLLKKSKSEEDRQICIPLLGEYLASHPQDVQAWFDLACCYDFCGLEIDAEPWYQKVYDIGWRSLPETAQPSYFVGFGSTLRNNSKLADSEKILREGIENFPDYSPLKVFLAFTLYSRGRHKESSQMLFKVAAEMPAPSFDGYERAIQWYTENLGT